MKKNFISLLIVVVAIALSIFACTKQSTEKQLKNQALLNKDETFIAMVNETNDYLIFLASRIKVISHFSKSELNTKLSELLSKNLSFDRQMKEIDVLFKTTVSKRLQNHMIVIQKSMKEIENNYGKIDVEILNREVEKVIALKALKINDSNMKPLAAPDCNWRYFLCSGAATAGAILCHGGCEATAIATTAGLGIPACVAACGTLQAWAIIECGDRFCSTK